MFEYKTCGSSVCAGAELYFPNVQPRDAGVYICTCRDQRSTNRSRAEIVVTSVFGLAATRANRCFPHVAECSTLNTYHLWFNTWVCLCTDYVRPHSLF